MYKVSVFNLVYNDNYRGDRERGEREGKRDMISLYAVEIHKRNANFGKFSSILSPPKFRSRILWNQAALVRDEKMKVFMNKIQYCRSQRAEYHYLFVT